MQGRIAVGGAVFHVQLVRHLVDHHVPAITRRRAVDVWPRQQHRPIRTRFARQHALAFVHQSVFVGKTLLTRKRAGINDNAFPVGVAFNIQVQHRQAGLRRNRQLLIGRQRLLIHAENRLVVQKPDHLLPQAFLLIVIQPGKQRLCQQIAPLGLRHLEFAELFVAPALLQKVEHDRAMGLGMTYRLGCMRR